MTKEIEEKVREQARQWFISSDMNVKDFALSVAKYVYEITTATPPADVQERAKEMTGIEKEVKASMLMMPPDDEYKKGWNGAMQKVLSIIKNYKDGNGIFQ